MLPPPPPHLARSAPTCCPRAAPHPRQEFTSGEMSRTADRMAVRPRPLPAARDPCPLPAVRDHRPLPAARSTPSPHPSRLRNQAPRSILQSFKWKGPVKLGTMHDVKGRSMHETEYTGIWSMTMPCSETSDAHFRWINTSAFTV